MIHSLNTDYERAERDTLISLAKPGDILYDIGAYVGWYSVEFANRVPHSRVYAFEPIPEIRRELILNTSHLNNITSYPMGLSDHSGIENFYISEKEPGTASLQPLEEDRFGPTFSIPAPVTTIDELPIPAPNMIKIDVEGAELLVLKGARETLAAHHPTILCEMLRKWMRRFGHHPNDLIDYLSSYGYKCYTLKLEPFARMSDDIEERNFFFIHPDRAESLNATL